MISGLKIPKLIRWIFSVSVIFLVIMTLLRVVLYLAFGKQGNHFSVVWPAFVLGLRYDLRDICILALLLMIVGSFPALNPFQTKTGKNIAFFLITFAAFLLVFFYSIDFAHYSYLTQRLNASVLNYLMDAGISARMVWQTYPVIRIIILLIIGTWFIRLLIKRTHKKIQTSSSVTTKKSRVTWFIICFLLFALAIFGRAGQFPLRWSDAFSLGDDYKANISLNPFQSFISSLKFLHSSYNEAKVKKAFALLAPYYGFTQNDSGKINTERNISPRSGALTTTPNVVVVICESFSAYKSSMWGNPLNTTPYFKTMCDNGIFFDHCFTPSYGTARGVWATITGIPDVEISTTTSSRNPAAVDQHTIINNFINYNKFYFIGGSTSWANVRGLLTNNIKGVHLYEQDDYDAPKIDVWGVSDKNLFLEANKVLAKQDKPFFAVIQTADNHRPYSIPKEDLNEFHKIDLPNDSLAQYGFMTNDEMNAFRYTDFGYEKFIEAAKQQPYFNNTVFLFVGDHGIAGDAANMFPKAWTDQRLTMEHVPLLIYSPKLLSPKRITSLCSQVDVLPTLAGLCNISYKNSTLGRDILDSANYTNKAFSFIYNPDQYYIGIIKGDYFYRRQTKTGIEEIVSVINNKPVADEIKNGPVKKEMQQMTDGIYETAKYLLLTNKKKQ
jgi:phosphoglycerol transferase MdoB-like AlkP superfamily enzyme